MNWLTLSIAVVAVAAAVCIYYYNSLIARKNTVGQAYSTIDVMLQRRAHLVPNLVALVERYARHEKEVLTRIAQLRAAAADRNGGLDSRVAADGEMDVLIHSLMLRVEQYADLRADANFRQLTASLDSMEAQIAASRHAYNAAVTVFNNAIEVFPCSLVAGLFGFRNAELLRASSDAAAVPPVRIH